MKNQQKKWIVPKQHGAWAMLMIPFLLGAYAGGFAWLHAQLFVGWLFLYLATYPLLMAVKSKRCLFSYCDNCSLLIKTRCAC
jgi:hypothetical protein